MTCIHYHHVVPSARISLTLSRPFSIVCCFRQVFRTRSCIGTELLYVGSSWLSCLLLVHVKGSSVCQLFVRSYFSSRVTSIWIVQVMIGRWPYSCCFVGCYLQYVFNIARSIFVLLPSSFFSICLVNVHVVHPYSSIDTITSWKKLRFILSVMSDFHMTEWLNKWIAVHGQLVNTALLITLMGWFPTGR